MTRYDRTMLVLFAIGSVLAWTGAIAFGGWPVVVGILALGTWLFLVAVAGLRWDGAP